MVLLRRTLGLALLRGLSQSRSRNAVLPERYVCYAATFRSHRAVRPIDRMKTTPDMQQFLDSIRRIEDDPTFVAE